MFFGSKSVLCVAILGEQFSWVSHKRVDALGRLRGKHDDLARHWHINSPLADQEIFTDLVSRKLFVITCSNI
jgi:hypothetical protein